MECCGKGRVVLVERLVQRVAQRYPCCAVRLFGLILFDGYELMMTASLAMLVREQTRFVHCQIEICAFDNMVEHDHRLTTERTTMMDCGDRGC
jgi:uncharacterized membrane protein